MLLLKFDCSGGAAIKDRAHSRLIIDGATKNCSIILFQGHSFLAEPVETHLCGTSVKQNFVSKKKDLFH